MKTTIPLVFALLGAFGLTTTAPAQTAPKMTTEIPPQITTPDSVETRIDTLKFFDECFAFTDLARRGSIRAGSRASSSW